MFGSPKSFMVEDFKKFPTHRAQSPPVHVVKTIPLGQAAWHKPVFENCIVEDCFVVKRRWILTLVNSCRYIIQRGCGQLNLHPFCHHYPHPGCQACDEPPCPDCGWEERQCGVVPSSLHLRGWVFTILRGRSSESTLIACLSSRGWKALSSPCCLPLSLENAVIQHSCHPTPGHLEFCPWGPSLFSLLHCQCLLLPLFLQWERNYDWTL